MPLIVPLVVPDTLDKSLVYYISGGMAGYPEHNFPLFEYVEQACLVAGLKVISPHKIKHDLGLTADDWHTFLRTDIRIMMKRCQGIILLKGWPQSQGANLETHVGLKVKFPAYYFHQINPSLAELIDMNKAA